MDRSNVVKKFFDILCSLVTYIVVFLIGVGVGIGLYSILSA